MTETCQWWTYPPLTHCTEEADMSPFCAAHSEAAAGVQYVGDIVVESAGGAS